MIVSLSLTACGGGSGGASGSTSESINGVVVPASPDPARNASTVAGVDANGDGIRDDVERRLATDFGTDAALLNKARLQAKADQALLVQGVDAYVALVCGRGRRYDKRLDAVTAATMNTEERLAVYQSLAEVVVVRDVATGQCSVLR